MTIKYRLFNDEQIEFILKHHKGVSIKEFTEIFNDHFGTKFKYTQFRDFYKRNGLGTGINSRFKAGNRPVGTFDVGAERINRIGQIEVKVSSYIGVRNWKPKAHVVWEKHHGAIPDGSTIIHLDGNKRNFDIDNLACVSRAELIRMTSKRRYHSDAEITKAGVLISKIEQKIYEKGKK